MALLVVAAIRPIEGIFALPAIGHVWIQTGQRNTVHPPSVQALLKGPSVSHSNLQTAAKGTMGHHCMVAMWHNAEA